MIYAQSMEHFLDRTKINKLPRMKREYELYKHRFLTRGGYEAGLELLTYEEFADINEEDDRD